MAYWDTSCLIKLYASEPDSPQFEALVRGGVRVVTSEIARLEFWASVRRKEASGDLAAGGAKRALIAFDADVKRGRMTIRPIDSALTERFEAIVDQCHSVSPAVAIRTLDAIYLATAAIMVEIQLVAADIRLRKAALLLGLTIHPP